jgi:hypothetical protein
VVLYEWLVRRELDDDEMRVVFDSGDQGDEKREVLETVEL